MGKKRNSLVQILTENRKKGNTIQLGLWDKHNLDTKMWKRIIIRKARSSWSFIHPDAWWLIWLSAQNSVSFPRGVSLWLLYISLTPFHPLPIPQSTVADFPRASLSKTETQSTTVYYINWIISSDVSWKCTLRLLGIWLCT